MIYGSGIAYISYGFLLLLMAIPFFIMTGLRRFHSIADQAGRSAGHVGRCT